MSEVFCGSAGRERGWERGRERERDVEGEGELNAVDN